MTRVSRRTLVNIFNIFSFTVEEGRGYVNTAQSVCWRDISTWEVRHKSRKDFLDRVVLYVLLFTSSLCTFSSLAGTLLRPFPRQR